MGVPGHLDFLGPPLPTASPAPPAPPTSTTPPVSHTTPFFLRRQFEIIQVFFGKEFHLVKNFNQEIYKETIWSFLV